MSRLMPVVIALRTGPAPVAGSLNATAWASIIGGREQSAGSIRAVSCPALTAGGRGDETLYVEIRYYGVKSPNKVIFYKVGQSAAMN